MIESGGGNRSPRICRYYLNSGHCLYGDSCQFLHAENSSGNFNFNSSPPSSSMMNANSIDGASKLATDGGLAGFSTASFPAGSRLQTYLMNQHKKISQNGSPVPSSTSAVKADNQNFSFPPLSSTLGTSYHPSDQLQRQPLPPPFVPIGSSQSTNHQLPLNQHQNFSINRFGSPPTGVLVNNFTNMSLRANQTSTPALPHSVSTPSFSSYNPDSSSIDGYQNITNAQSPRQTPTPPNAIPIGRHRMSKSPSAISETPPMVLQEAIGGTTYFFNHDESASSVQQQSTSLLPNFFVYSGPPSNLPNLKPRGAGSASFFVPNELKMELIHRHLLSLAQTDVEHHPDVPQEVDCYNQVVPLDFVPKNQMVSEKARFFNCLTSVYKATNTKDGLAYCFRRIHGFRLSNLRNLGVIDAWKKVQHSNIVQIREVFTTKLFGDYSLVFVYDYYPGAETLKQRHFGVGGGGGSPRMNGLRPNAFFDDVDSQRNRGSLVKGTTGNRFPDGLVSETLLWCYIVQLSSALRTVHSAGLAARTIDPSKILIVGKSRLLVNCCGIFDVMTFDHAQTNAAAMTQNYQQEDLIGLGRIVLALACQNLMPAQRDQLQLCVEHIHRNYSMDLKNLILYLLAPNRTKNVNDVMPMIGARFYSQIDAATMRIDLLENELSKELENGRLFRLLSKLGSVNERPEYNMDPQWSETGDRYLLKLFRDYLFHQVNEEGKPWLDMAHVVQCLNKLDAGVPEKIMLSSRDQQNVLVVSYADLRRCLDQAFNELVRPVGGVGNKMVPNGGDLGQN